MEIAVRIENSSVSKAIIAKTSILSQTRFNGARFVKLYVGRIICVM